MVQIAALEAELRDQRRFIAILIHKAGGSVTLSPQDLLDLGHAVLHSQESEDSRTVRYWLTDVAPDKP